MRKQYFYIFINLKNAKTRAQNFFAVLDMLYFLCRKESNVFTD